MHLDSTILISLSFQSYSVTPYPPPLWKSSSKKIPTDDAKTLLPCQQLLDRYRIGRPACWVVVPSASARGSSSYRVISPNAD